MKKTISVNLNGKAFVINEDAYERLDAYLYNQGSKSQETEKILADMLTNILHKKGSSIIEIDDVEEAISKIEDNTAAETLNNPTKLCRSNSDKILGGVCSGLAKYFDIDKVLVRLLMLMFVFASFGWALLFYFVMWIVMPSDKKADPNASNDGCFAVGLKVVLVVLGFCLAIAVILFCGIIFAAAVVSFFTNLPDSITWFSGLCIALMCLVPVAAIVLLIVRLVNKKSNKAMTITAWVLLALWLVSIVGFTCSALSEPVNEDAIYIIMDDLLNEASSNVQTISSYTNGLPVDSLDGVEYVVCDSLDMIDAAIDTTMVQ